MESLLFTPYVMGNLRLRNRIVMAPMTRSRAIGNVPNQLMEKYYEQRASAGLIITEGVSPSPNGLGYARIPGLYSSAQIEAWKKVTDKVHNRDGLIFAQLMHTGRIGNLLNLPAGAEIVGPSAIQAIGTQIFTDQQGMQPSEMPRALGIEEINELIGEFVKASENAIEAGFDGVELHAANGYLLEQFLNSASNNRDDIYGGVYQNRNRFVLEVARGVAEAIGKEKVGVRVSPYGIFNDIIPDGTTDDQYIDLARGLGQIGISYIHIVDHSSMGGPIVPYEIKEKIRQSFNGTFILSGGYSLQSGEEDLSMNKGDLVAFGRPFIANPDFVERIGAGIPLTEPDPSTFYTGEEKGYTDYTSFGSL